MLIVIVIIGILAAALIPRISGMQGRARNTARVADLQQVWTALSLYNADNGGYPMVETWGFDIAFAWGILDNYIPSIPKDPQAGQQMSGIPNSGGMAVWQYGYIAITKGGVRGSAFVLMAKMEGVGATPMNRGYNGSLTTGGSITWGTDFATLRSDLCTQINGGTAFDISSPTACVVDDGEGRYIYTNS